MCDFVRDRGHYMNFTICTGIRTLDERLTTNTSNISLHNNVNNWNAISNGARHDNTVSRCRKLFRKHCCRARSEKNRFRINNLLCSPAHRRASSVFNVSAVSFNALITSSAGKMTRSQENWFYYYPICRRTVSPCLIKPNWLNTFHRFFYKAPEILAKMCRRLNVFVADCIT